MGGKIQARSIPGDIRVGQNLITAVAGGYAITAREDGDHIAFAVIGDGQDLSATLWNLTPSDTTNTYTAIAA